MTSQIIFIRCPSTDQQLFGYSIWTF